MRLSRSQPVLDISGAQHKMIVRLRRTVIGAVDAPPHTKPDAAIQVAQSWQHRIEPGQRTADAVIETKARATERKLGFGYAGFTELVATTNARVIFEPLRIRRQATRTRRCRAERHGIPGASEGA